MAIPPTRVRDADKARTTFEVMPGSATLGGNPEDVLGESVRGFVDPRGLFDVSDRLYMKAQIERHKAREREQEQQDRERILMFRLASAQQQQQPSVPALVVSPKSSSSGPAQPNVKVKINVKRKPSVGKGEDGTCSGTKKGKTETEERKSGALSREVSSGAVTLDEREVPELLKERSGSLVQYSDDEDHEG